MTNIKKMDTHLFVNKIELVLKNKKKFKFLDHSKLRFKTVNKKSKIYFQCYLNESFDEKYYFYFFNKNKSLDVFLLMNQTTHFSKTF